MIKVVIGSKIRNTAGGYISSALTREQFMKEIGCGIQGMGRARSSTKTVRFIEAILKMSKCGGMGFILAQTDPR